MTDYPAEIPIEHRVGNGVASIILNRPARLNAFNRDMLVQLRQALESSAADESVRAICLTGAGRAFSAGQDLAERDPRTLDGPLDLDALQHQLYHPVIRAMTEADKPVVVAVNGIAAGAGAAIALAGDIVLAAASARFIFSFARVGLSLDAGLGWHLVRALGPARARALAMTAGEIDAAEAERAGLIFRCIADDDLAAAAGALAAELAEGPRVALGAIKKAVRAAETADDLAGYLKIEAALQGEAGRSSDYAEGVLAFLERRKPDFRG